MAETGKYIYGVTKSHAQLDFCAPINSSGTERVCTIPYQDISAVVSDSEIADYTNMRKDALARLLVKHQRVIEKVMSLGHTVLPMRLGTLVDDEITVKGILHKGYDLIKSIMEKVDDKVEVDVVATWSDISSVIKEVQEEKEIKEFKEQLLSGSKKVTVDDQMKAGLMVQKALEKKREHHAVQIQSELKAVSEGIKEHELMDDKMVVNSAFLLEKSRQDRFERKVNELNAQFEEKLNFRCVGPLPPYSFYTLDVKKMQYKDLDWAKRKLRLGDFSSSQEIKKAYRRAALSSHPDHNPGASGAEKELDDVKKAYEILTDYGLACQQADKTDSYSLDEEEFEKNAVLVTVK
jgi:hypothetical protein